MRNYGMSGMTDRECRCRQQGRCQMQREDSCQGEEQSRMRREDMCSEEKENVGEMNFALAMAYVPWQYYKETYDPDKALEIGTIFPELNKPFMEKGRMYR
ncbi:MAG: spore coat associated protein CotJA [Roseburia sp.]